MKKLLFLILGTILFSLSVNGQVAKGYTSLTDFTLITSNTRPYFLKGKSTMYSDSHKHYKLGSDSAILIFQSQTDLVNGLKKLFSYCRKSVGEYNIFIGGKQWIFRVESYSDGGGTYLIWHDNNDTNIIFLSESTLFQLLEYLSK